MLGNVKSFVKSYLAATALTFVNSYNSQRFDMEPTTFTKRLNIALKESGLSQADVSRHCGVSTASVSNWFTGVSKSGIPLRVLPVLCT